MATANFDRFHSSEIGCEICQADLCEHPSRVVWHGGEVQLFTTAPVSILASILASAT